MRWVGIDEAGYGPNLGPLVMTAVVVEDREAIAVEPGRKATSAPDLWRDLAATVDRAGGDTRRLWIDDSKAILRGGKGRDRLEAGCLAVLGALGVPPPRSIDGLFQALGAGSLEESELEPWLTPTEEGRACPWCSGLEDSLLEIARDDLRPPGRTWRIVGLRSVVLGPSRFNARLAATGSKARVHFSVFRELLALAWELAADGLPTHLEGDKHGGRHFYLEPLVEALPGTWIERGTEGPLLSRYFIGGAGRELTVSLAPRADATNGLVALASMVSKLVREIWMDAFNDFWGSRIEGLRPTAGYPTDATRFRAAIEPMARDLGLDRSQWWREK